MTAIGHKTPIRIDIKRSEMTLSPNDELECRQIYEKLQRLQPNGVCVNLNTLRRALYPPSNNINNPILSFKTYRRDNNELPKIRICHTSKQTKVNKIDLNRIVNQVKQHSAINYSYYTRTK